MTAVIVMCVSTYASFFFFFMVNKCRNIEQTLAVLQLRGKKKSEGLLGLEPTSHEHEPDSSRSVVFA